MTQCNVSECNGALYAKGLCRKHYERKRRTGRLYIVVSFKNKGKNCKIKSCDKEANVNGVCQKHYDRFRKYGNYKKRTNKGEKNCNWNGGTSEYPNHYQMKKIREELLSKNSLCQHYKKEKSFCIHHLDKKKGNHDIKNLIVVCAKCHIRYYHKGEIGRPKGSKKRFSLTRF